MKAIKQAAWVIAVLLIFQALPTEISAGSTVPVRMNGIRITTGTVRSIHEVRQSKVVRQGWDSSCGAAALVTVLRYHYGADVDESTAVLSMLTNTEPAKVRARRGFSLLDLKRFAEALGYEAAGYSGLTLDDLAGFNIPVITPVRVLGYDHFVVFKGVAGGRVLIGDPASGNVTMTMERFREIWPSSIGFVVTARKDVTADAPATGVRSPMSPAEMDMAVPDLNYVTRVVNRLRPVPNTRRPRIILP